MVPEMGSGHRAGGADLASGVDTAGTVARIDLRLPHHPASVRPPSLLAPMRPLGSLSGVIFIFADAFFGGSLGRFAHNTLHVYISTHTNK